jgi:hypothetical protein
MTYTADLDYYIRQAKALGTEARNLLGECAKTQGNERASLLRTIDQKIAKARDFLQAVEIDIPEIRDEKVLSEYNSVLEDLRGKIRILEQEARAAVQEAQVAEQNRAAGRTTADLMAKSRSLQQEQLTSVDNAITTIERIQSTGADALTEIGRQKEQIGHTSSDLHEIDSELVRARKILKRMLTRAAGDTCVRILAIAVILSAVAVIIVEAIKPGTVKKTADGWMNNDGQGE